MKLSIATLFCSLLLTPLTLHAADFSSSYTSIKKSDCKSLADSHSESLRSCESFGGIEVQIGEFVSDKGAIQNLTLVRDGQPIPLEFWSQDAVNKMEFGDKVEWRHKKGNPNEIVGMIVRVNVAEKAAKDKKTQSYLGVVKVHEGDFCVVGKLAPQEKQNERAQTMAQESHVMSCLKSSDNKTSDDKASKNNDDNVIYFDIETKKWRDNNGVCNTCTPENGFSTPKVKDGFFFHPILNKWHDKHGVCNTCTPENGFPENPK